MSQAERFLRKESRSILRFEKEPHYDRAPSCPLAAALVGMLTPVARPVPRASAIAFPSR
jgi:hypothetical protein